MQAQVGDYQPGKCGTLLTKVTIAEGKRYAREFLLSANATA